MATAAKQPVAESGPLLAMWLSLGADFEIGSLSNWMGMCENRGRPKTSFASLLPCKPTPQRAQSPQQRHTHVLIVSGGYNLSGGIPGERSLIVGL